MALWVDKSEILKLCDRENLLHINVLDVGGNRKEKIIIPNVVVRCQDLRESLPAEFQGSAASVSFDNRNCTDDTVHD